MKGISKLKCLVLFSIPGELFSVLVSESLFMLTRWAMDLEASHKLCVLLCFSFLFSHVPLQIFSFFPFAFISCSFFCICICICRAVR